jgi:4-hydroxy-tetrahydrodipicolinate reductase
MKLLLVGHGKMGRLVESLAPSYGCEVAGIATAHQPLTERMTHGVDVAVDFSVAAAVPETLRALAEHKIDVVIGTTGWQAHETELRGIAARAGIGVFAAANFSPGVHIFQAVVAEAARRFAARDDVGAWIHESHHAAKKDAPSGTAVMLKGAMSHAGYPRAIDVSSTRAGSIPGTHTAGFDAPSETVTLTHAVRDRAVFARGALEAAQWIKGRTGWFGMGDMLNA